MIDIKDIFINFTITIIAYMGFPLYKFGIKKEINNLKLRKKIIFWNSVVTAILFIITRSILYGIEFGVRNFAPAFLYYMINRFLYIRKNENEEIFSNETNKDLINVINIMQNTINNAKKDLKTGIKKEQLDEMLENNYITQENYDEVLKSIKSLEMLANFDIAKLKNNINNENNYSVENNEDGEYDEDLEDMYSSDEEE